MSLVCQATHQTVAPDQVSYVDEMEVYAHNPSEAYLHMACDRSGICCREKRCRYACAPPVAICEHCIFPSCQGGGL